MAKWPTALSLATVVALAPSWLPSVAQAPALAAELREPAHFNPDVVRAPANSVLEAVLLARSRGDKETARALATAGLVGSSTRDEPLLRWIAAQSARAADATSEASELLFPLALSNHPLSAWAKLNVAEWLEIENPGRALALLDILLVPSSELESWPGKQQAERLRARVLGKIGRRDDAINAFEKLLANNSDDASAVQLLMPLAELLAERSETDRVRAVSLYHKVAARVPDTRLGKRAEELAASLVASLPPALANPVREPALEDRLVRAEVLLNGLHYKEALAAFLELEPQLIHQPALWCRARFGRAKTLLDNRARTEGATLMVEVAEQCAQDADQRAWARYQAGRALSALGQNELAIAQYEALEREAPNHRLADDALFRAAKVAKEMGDGQGARARLAALPGRYPQGDMHARARFSLAFQLAAERDYKGAADILASDERDEPGEDLQGRASYFRARYLAEQRRFQEAADLYAHTIRRHPFSYYGMSAFSRLSRMDPARARTLMPPLPTGPAPALTFEATHELMRPGFTRALALFSAGELTLAVAELRALGFLEPNRSPELTWLCAALLDRAGAPHLSVDMVRKRMPDLLARQPVGRNLALYQLVYPLAFAPLVEESAQKEGVSAAFVRAVAREESGFYPKAVSRSGAYGLIQLLESTARAVSKGGLNLPSTPTALQEPEINLALGTHFIATLTQAVGGEMALVPAAYNAGPAATARWVAQRGHEPLDTWIENIPYDETRTYTRRVLQTYGIYHWLQTGQLLSLPEHLPNKGGSLAKL